MSKQSFNIDNIFQSSTPQIERDMLRKSDAFPFAVGVRAALPLWVSRVYYPTLLGQPQTKKLRVAFSNQDGIEVVRLTRHDDNDTWSVDVSMGVLTNTWTTSAESKRLGYLTKAVLNRKTGVHEEVSNASTWTWAQKQHDMVKTLVRNAHYKFMNSRRVHTNFRDILTSEQIGVLLSVFFGEQSSVDVSTEQRQVFDTVRSTRDKHRNVALEVNTLMQDMFGQPKWLISYVPDKGYSVSGVDMSVTWKHVLSHDDTPEHHYATTHRLMSMRSLEDMPSEVKERIMGTLTMNKMHMRNRYPGIKYGVEPHDMVPSEISTTIVCDELGSMVLSVSNATIMMVNQ